jgi:trimeric autotransporter adhesin
MTALRVIKSIGRSSSRLALLLIPLVFACFALSPMAQAVSPAPDGDYPGGNTAEGFNALFNLSAQDGSFNTAIGWVSLFSNTTGSLNTGVGAGALFLNTSHNNTAVGAGTLALNTTGDGNTANGALALLQNTVGRGNTAVGAATLLFNTDGSGNTAVGAQALQKNAPTCGLEDSSLNTAVGLEALTENTTGFDNTAVGAGTTAIPFAPGPTLGKNTTGSENTAIGTSALSVNTTGSQNTAIGVSALTNLAPPPNPSPNRIGSNNIAVGFNAGNILNTGNNNIYIGNEGGDTDESATIRIGRDNIPIPQGFAPCPPASPTPTVTPTPTPAPVPTRTFIAGISGTAVVGDAVVVAGNGQLGTVASAARFKKDIRPMDKTSEAIFAVRPVTFEYKSDSKGTPQFGLIAEEVAKVNPNLVVRDKDGQIYSVRYDAVNAMLLNEFLNEHKTVQEQGATITRLEKQIEALTAGLQKVSAQVELSKPAPQTVVNSR